MTLLLPTPTTLSSLFSTNLALTRLAASIILCFVFFWYDESHHLCNTDEQDLAKSQEENERHDPAGSQLEDLAGAKQEDRAGSSWIKRENKTGLQLSCEGTVGSVRSIEMS